MARVSVQIKFMFQDILFVDSQAYLPRGQAIKIPGLRAEQRRQKPAGNKPQESKSEQPKSEDDEDEMVDENDNDNENDENQGEADADEMQVEEIEEDENIPENQEQIDGSENIQYDDDEDDQLEENQSSISRSMSNMAHFGKYKTKRQKGELDHFIQLPNKRPRKDNKKSDEATELIRKQQKQRKRKQYIKKLMEAQQKATFQKILNETGRKFKQRQEKQLKDELLKEHRSFRSLGDVPKIITKQINENQAYSKLIMLHKTSLFPKEMTRKPEIRMGEICEACNKQTGKYKSPAGKHFCSVPCFKILIGSK